MRKVLFSFFLLFVAVMVQAQILEPVKFKYELLKSSTSGSVIEFTATIDKGWHVYSTDLGDGGPISATIHIEKMVGAELKGQLKPVGKEIAAFDKLFGMKVRYFEHSAKFAQEVVLKSYSYQIEGYLEKRIK